MSTTVNDQYRIIEGTVVDERINKDLHVYGEIDGGGGSISGGGGSVSTNFYGYTSGYTSSVRGNISPVHGNISSTTIETQELWVETYDGKEMHVNLGTNIVSLQTKLVSGSIPIRKGHEIAMLFNQDGRLMYLYIKNTEQLFKIFDVSDEPIYDPDQPIPMFFSYLIWVVGSLCGLHSIWNGGFIAGALIILVSIILGMLIFKLCKKSEKQEEERKAKWTQDKEKWVQEKNIKDKAIDSLRNTKLQSDNLKEIQ